MENERVTERVYPSDAEGREEMWLTKSEDRRTTSGLQGGGCVAE